jgi:hypothetical protein
MLGIVHVNQVVDTLLNTNMTVTEAVQEVVGIQPGALSLYDLDPIHDEIMFCRGCRTWQERARESATPFICWDCELENA